MKFDEALRTVPESDLIYFFAECRAHAETLNCDGCSGDTHPELAAAWNAAARAAYAHMGDHLGFLMAFCIHNAKLVHDYCPDDCQHRRQCHIHYRGRKCRPLCCVISLRGGLFRVKLDSHLSAVQTCGSSSYSTAQPRLPFAH